MTITLYLQKETLLRDLATLQHIFQMNIESVEVLKKHYQPLGISSTEFSRNCITIQVTPEEFALIGAFSGEF